MNISVVVRGVQAAREKLAALAERMRDLKPVYLRAGAVVLTDAQGRIDAQGPGWKPAAYDYGKGSLLHRNGALFRSLTVGGTDNIEQDIPNGIRVGTDLKTEDGLNIGRLMQYGTGIYGAMHRPITPKNGKALAINVGGKTIFRKSSKGSPARPFLFVSDKTAEKVVALFAQRVTGEFNGN